MGSCPFGCCNVKVSRSRIVLNARAKCFGVAGGSYTIRPVPHLAVPKVPVGSTVPQQKHHSNQYPDINRIQYFSSILIRMAEDSYILQPGVEQIITDIFVLISDELTSADRAEKDKTYVHI